MTVKDFRRHFKSNMLPKLATKGYDFVSDLIWKGLKGRTKVFLYFDMERTIENYTISLNLQFSFEQLLELFHSPPEDSIHVNMPFHLALPEANFPNYFVFRSVEELDKASELFVDSIKGRLGEYLEEVSNFEAFGKLLFNDSIRDLYLLNRESRKILQVLWLIWAGRSKEGLLLIDQHLEQTAGTLAKNYWRIDKLKNEINEGKVRLTKFST